MTQTPARTKRQLEGAETKQPAKHLKLSPMLSSSGLDIHTNSVPLAAPVEYQELQSSLETKTNQGLYIPSFEVMYNREPYNTIDTIESQKVSNPVFPNIKTKEETDKAGERIILEQSQSSKVKSGKSSPILSATKMSTNVLPSPTRNQVAKKQVHLEDGRKACPECDEIKKNLIEMLIHLKEKHKDSERPYPCPRRSCQRFFIEKEDVERHFKEEHRISKRGCKRCYCRLRNSKSELCTKCSKVVKNSQANKVTLRKKKVGVRGQEAEFLMPPPNLPSVVQFPNGFVENSKHVDFLKPAAGVAEAETMSLAETPLKKWLSQTGVSPCYKGLHDEGVENLAQLLELTNQDIVELAKTYKWKLLHRRRLLTEREKLLKNTGNTSEAKSYSQQPPSSQEKPQVFVPSAPTELTSPVPWIFSLPPLESVPTNSVSPNVSRRDTKEEPKVETKYHSPIGSTQKKAIETTVEPNTNLKHAKPKRKAPDSFQVHLPDGRKACPECPVIKKNLIELLIHLKENHEDCGLPLNCPRKGCPRFFVLQEDVDEHFLSDHVPKLASGMCFNANLRQALKDMLGSKEKTEYYEQLYNLQAKARDKRRITPVIPINSHADFHSEPSVGNRGDTPSVGSFLIEQSHPRRKLKGGSTFMQAQPKQ